MKKQLENRWKNINEKLQAQEGLESDDAAALRKYVSTLRSAGEDGGKGPFWCPHIAEMNICAKVVFVFPLDSWWTDLTASPATDPLSSTRTRSESASQL